MLLELNIENFAIIEKACISFTDGLNIITGETGTGKSIMVDALNLVLGARSDKTYIKEGKEKTLVQALFLLKDKSRMMPLLYEYGIELEDDNSLLISRETHLSGRSVVRVNGHIVTLSMLNKLTEKLIDIQGQHENQSLMQSERHIEFIDLLGDENLREVREEVKKEYGELVELKKRLKNLSENDMERERAIDLLQFQVTEIDEFSFSVDEEEELIKAHRLLTNAEELSKLVSSVTDKLSLDSFNSKSLIDEVRDISRLVSKISSYDESLSVYEESLEDIAFRLEDISREMSSYGENIEFDFEKLSEVENKISVLNKLKRKYGDSISEILEYRDKTLVELEVLKNLDQEIEKVQNEITKKEKLLRNYSAKLTEMRKEIGKKLESQMMKELRELNMKDVEFRVDISDLDHFTKTGRDKVEFLISTNIGQKLKPMSKIASGGEMSRIMLAFKNILAEVDEINTLVFDEIDTGISGRTAQIVGEKIEEISKKHQVICITHLPQIAAMSDTHFLINKERIDDTTETSIIKLREEEKIDEICRLISGVCVTDITRRHAREMLSLSRQFKKQSSENT